MADLQRLPEAPCQVRHRCRDVVLQSQDALAFPDAILVHQWGVGAWGAWGAERRPAPLPDQSPDENHTALHQCRPVLADEDVQKSVCRAAYRPMSGLLLPALCKSGAGRSGA